MSAPLLALLIALGLLGYWIVGRVGAFGLWKLGGEGDQMNGDTQVRNSGDSAAPSPPEKRLFMVGRLGGQRPGAVSYIWRGRLYTVGDSGLPVDLKAHIEGRTR